ncbi:MAG: polymer-forming cytoskeletal protein [Nitrospinae bacterium]|nr:polymer-forming cytoskeletal protein [Nitrospinota bacterium]
MFSSKNQAARTFLGRGATFKGVLTVKGTLNVDQNFEGQINSDILIINEAGVVEGNVIAGFIVCKGKINGNAIALEKLELLCNGSITGDVHTPSMNIEEGARLNGRCYVSRTGAAAT